MDEVAYLGQPPFRIDLLRAIDGIATRDALQGSLAADWDGVSVRVIALDDLITNKRAAGRPQDLADVEKLERVRAKLRGSSR